MNLIIIISRKHFFVYNIIHSTKKILKTQGADSMKKEMAVNMTEGNVTRVLLTFAIPVFISNLFQQLYNVVDITVIGHILGDDALAAVGATTSVYSLILGFINGMSNGFCVVIARYFGAGENNSFRKSVHLSAALSLIAAIALTVFSLLFLRPLLLLLHTPESILHPAQNYISVILLFCSVTVAYNLLSSMLRAIGNSRVPLYALILASLLNIFLDLFLVGFIGMGVAGAALATVAAQIFSVIYLVLYIAKSCPLLHFSPRYFAPEKQMAAELATTGLSMAMMLVLTNIGSVAMQGSINSFGTSTITGHTAARKFHDLCMMPFGTVCTGTATFVSQNYGARKKDRIKQGIRSSIMLGSIWSIFVLLILLLFGKNLIQALTGTSDSTVLSIAMQYLYWNVPFYFILNILLIMRNSLQALGGKILPLIASMAELIGKFAGAFCLTHIMGYLGICWTEPLTWIVCFPIVLAGFFIRLKKDR